MALNSNINNCNLNSSPTRRRPSARRAFLEVVLANEGLNPNNQTDCWSLGTMLVHDSLMNVRAEHSFCKSGCGLRRSLLYPRVRRSYVPSYLVCGVDPEARLLTVFAKP